MLRVPVVCWTLSALIHVGHHFFPILHTLTSHWKLETSQSRIIYTTEMGIATSHASPYLCSSHPEQTVKHLLVQPYLNFKFSGTNQFQ